MPFTIASTVYYSIKSKKNLQDICAKYVKLLIDIKDLNKWNGISCSWIGRVKAVVKLIILPKLIHRCDVTTIKTPDGFFTEIDKNGVKK